MIQLKDLIPESLIDANMVGKGNIMNHHLSQTACHQLLIYSGSNKTSIALEIKENSSHSEFLVLNFNGSRTRHNKEVLSKPIQSHLFSAVFSKI